MQTFLRFAAAAQEKQGPDLGRRRFIPQEGVDRGNAFAVPDGRAEDDLVVPAYVLATQTFGIDLSTVTTGVSLVGCVLSGVLNTSLSS